MNLTSIVFTGYYGMQNTGDDAFCLVSAWGARQCWHAGQVRFLSSSLPEMDSPAEALFSPKAYFRGQRILEAAVHLVGQKTLVYAGGSTFHRPISLLSQAMVAKAMRRCRMIELGAIGVSLGPFRNVRAERDCREFLKGFSFLVLRDRKSYEIAGQMQLPCQPVEGRDLAFLLPSVCGPLRRRQPGADGGKPMLGITVCHYERYVNQPLTDEHKREGAVLETLRLLAERIDVRYRFFVFNNHPVFGDAELTNALVSQLPTEADAEIVAYSRNTGLTWQRIGECDAFFSTRLHGAIFAAAARVPFVLVEYHRKCSDLLDDMHWPSGFRVGDMERSANAVADMLAEAVSRPGWSNLPDVRRMERLAMRNFLLTEDRCGNDQG